MKVWTTTHNQVRYALILSGGTTIIFELAGGAHLLSDHSVIVDEIRTPDMFPHMFAGNQVSARSRHWARKSPVSSANSAASTGSSQSIALAPDGAFARVSQRMSVEDGEAVMESARQIKLQQVS